MREDHAAPRAAGGILRARAHGGSTQSLGIACEGGASDLIDFSVNVNPAGPSPRAVAAACKALSRIDAYPDRESLALVRALARAQGIPEDTIVCGAGASSSRAITRQKRCTTGWLSDQPIYTVCFFSSSTEIYASLCVCITTSGTPFTARSNCSHVNSESARCGTSAYTPAATASAACLPSLSR